MSFFKQKVSFSLNIASHFSVMTHNVCKFLAQPYITWAKKFLKAQFLRFLSVPMKFINIFLSFMKAQIIFPLKFVSIFNMITHNSSLLFWLKHNILSTTVAHQSANFHRLATALIKMHQIPHLIFGTKSQLFFKLCHKT